MNLKLTDQDIEQTWRALIARQPRVSGRQLRQALKAQFGTMGRTDRVFAIWRQLKEQHQRSTRDPPTAVERRLADAERAAAEARAAQQAAERRAELAEERERVHQERWANEIYELRAQVQRLTHPTLPT